jgi:hypothetical protein
LHSPWTVLIGTRQYLSVTGVLMSCHVCSQPTFFLETFLAYITNKLCIKTWNKINCWYMFQTFQFYAKGEFLMNSTTKGQKLSEKKIQTYNTSLQFVCSPLPPGQKWIWRQTGTVAGEGSCKSNKNSLYIQLVVITGHAGPQRRVRFVESSDCFHLKANMKSAPILRKQVNSNQCTNQAELSRCWSLQT